MDIEMVASRTQRKHGRQTSALSMVSAGLAAQPSSPHAITNAREAETRTRRTQAVDVADEVEVNIAAAVAEAHSILVLHLLSMAMAHTMAASTMAIQSRRLASDRSNSTLNHKATVVVRTHHT